MNIFKLLKSIFFGAKPYQNTTYIQVEAPVNTKKHPLLLGDLWIDNVSKKSYIWTKDKTWKEIDHEGDN